MDILLNLNTMLNNDTWHIGTAEVIILFILVVIILFFAYIFSRLLKRK